MAENLFNDIEKSKSAGEDTIDFEKILADIIDHWKWFLIGVIVMLSLGFIYIKHAAPMYKVNATVMVDDEQKGGMSGMLGDATSGSNGSFGGLGSLLNSKSSVDNELLILQTRDLMRKVVTDMHLYVICY
jgi:tyrosine-protein kinase Etk/Wzc